MTEKIREILTDLGYELRDCGKEFRAKPIYRDSDNSTSLCIHKDTGYWCDFSMGISGKFDELVQITLKLDSLEDAQKWREKRLPCLAPVHSKPVIREPREFDETNLEDIIPKHEYWVNRGISIETLRIFNGGLVLRGKMAGRYVFPIFGSKRELLGFTGRDIFDNPERNKWKHIGDKMEWKYPLINNYQFIKIKREVILIESIGDMLALWEAGIKTTMVVFGIMLGSPRLQTLLKIDPNRIIIATNNDEEKLIGEKMVSPGVEGANKIEKSLLNYFDAEQIRIALPDKKDFGEMSKEEIITWYEGCSL